MVRRTLFGLVSAMCLGCGSGSPSDPRRPEVVHISPRELARVFRHNPADKTWLNCYVRCRLEPRSYSVHRDRIEAHCVNNDAGCVWFVTTIAPPDSDSALVVVGCCRGIVRDGQFREAGVDYYVRVEATEIVRE